MTPDPHALYTAAFLVPPLALLVLVAWVVFRRRK